MKILQCKAHPSGLLIIQLHYARLPLIFTTLNSPPECECPSKNALGSKGLRDWEFRSWGQACRNSRAPLRELWRVENSLQPAIDASRINLNNCVTTPSAGTVGRIIYFILCISLWCNRSHVSHNLLSNCC